MRFLFLSCLIFLSYGGDSQIMGVTDTGDKVILYSDGHWIYAERDSVREEEIPTNAKAFKKSKDADFLLKSERTKTGFWLNPKVWTFTTPEADAAAEYELDHENGSLYGLVITENLDLSLTALANIALQNAREAAPDIKVTDKEYRMVNGKKNIDDAHGRYDPGYPLLLFWLLLHRSRSLRPVPGVYLGNFHGRKFTCCGRIVKWVCGFG
jgi:hypothetical protein